VGFHLDLITGMTAVKIKIDNGPALAYVLTQVSYPVFMKGTTMKPDAVKKTADSLKDDLITFCRKLLQTPSMPGQEEAACRLTVTEMEKLGYDEAYIDGVGNAIGLVKGEDPNAPIYMLNSHIDHVDPGERGEWRHDPYSGDIEGDKIYGRGASDTKGAFAVQVYAPAVLKKMGLKPKGDVYVTGVVLEEVSGFGTRYILDHLGKKPDCVILGEATENNIKLGHRGGIRIEASFFGKSVHASAPDRGINPHYAAARFLLKLEEALPSLRSDPDLGQTTVAPTLYRTGVSSANVVPGQVDLMLDMRSSGESTADALALYRRIADEVCPADVRVAFAELKQTIVSYTGEKDPLVSWEKTGYKLEWDNPFVQKAVSVIEGTLGASPQFGYWLFGTDGRFTAAEGIPTYGFSPCEESLAHTADDHVKIDMMMDSLYCYPQIIG
jgi:succinyl-diaminopimelate desuccinylase